MQNLNRAKAHFRRVLFLLASFLLVVNLLLLAMPLYMLQIYDRILPSRSMDTLLFLSIIAGGALVVLGLLEAVRAVLASRAGARLEADLGTDALLASMERSRSGETDIDAVRHLATIRQFVSSRMLFALLDFPFAPIFIVILYIIHPTLFWLTLRAPLFCSCWPSSTNVCRATRRAGLRSNKVPPCRWLKAWPAMPIPCRQWV